MGPYNRMRDAVIAAVLMIACVIACSMACRDARACDAEPICLMRVRDAPVIVYPQTRDFAVHGAPVTLSFGTEVYIIEPTRDELLYGMRYSREP